MALYHHQQVQQDLKELLQQNVPWQQLQNKTVLITGATGMLASYLGFMLLFLNEQLKLNIKPIFLARSQHKLSLVYGEALAGAHCLIQDICEPVRYDGVIDYVVHAAGPASPYAIKHNPVGIIQANVQGTLQVSELARQHQTINILFVSTREVYGAVEAKECLHEQDMGWIDPLDPRDCYPESKRLAEALLMAYHTQYQIRFNTVRLAHSYGPGMQLENDGRVMADLMNDAVQGRDIQLNSTGEAERAFCYVTDAVSGLLRVMLQGKPCHAYNLANEQEPTMVRDLAHLLQRLTGKNKDVLLQSKGTTTAYTTYKRTALDTSKLRELGWQPYVSLTEGLIRTLKVHGGLS